MSSIAFMKPCVRPDALSCSAVKQGGLMKTIILTACIALALGTLIGRTTVASSPVMVQTTIEAMSISQLMNTIRALPAESYDAI